MKRNKTTPKSTAFSFILHKEKRPLAGFALLPLEAWRELLKRPPASLLLEDIIYISTAGSNSLMSSKCPPSEVLTQRPVLLRSVREQPEESRGQNHIADPGYQWLMSNVTMKPSRGCCTFGFIGHHAGRLVVKKDLHYYSTRICRAIAEQRHDDTLGFGNWILVLFPETTMYRAIPVWLWSNHSGIEYYVWGSSKFSWWWNSILHKYNKEK